MSFITKLVGRGGQEEEEEILVWICLREIVKWSDETFGEKIN